MKSVLILILVSVLGSVSTLSAQEKDDSLKVEKRKNREYNNPFNERHFGFGYWMLGLYAGTENFETASFGINFPIINQNMSGRLFPRKPKPVLSDSVVIPGFFHASFGSFKSGRYWIPTPLPKRLSLQLGVERNFSSLVYRPEIGVVCTPFSLFFSGFGAGNKYLNHVLISGEFLPSVRNDNAAYRFGGGYMFKLMKPRIWIFKYNAVRFYFLYHYSLSKDWSGHLFTFQVNYNREPYHRKYNPIHYGYRNW